MFVCLKTDQSQELRESTVHASICNISIAQPTGLGYNVTDRLINKHNTATNFIFEYVWANQKYFKGNFVLMNNKNVIL